MHSVHSYTMLTEIYIEAFDEELADQVWEAWNIGEDDQVAWLAWWLIAGGCYPIAAAQEILVSVNHSIVDSRRRFVSSDEFFGKWRE